MDSVADTSPIPCWEELQEILYNNKMKFLPLRIDAENQAYLQSPARDLAEEHQLQQHEPVLPQEGGEPVKCSVRR